MKKIIFILSVAVILCTSCSKQGKMYQYIYVEGIFESISIDMIGSTKNNKFEIKDLGENNNDSLMWDQAFLDFTTSIIAKNKVSQIMPGYHDLGGSFTLLRIEKTDKTLKGCEDLIAKKIDIKDFTKNYAPYISIIDRRKENMAIQIITINRHPEIAPYLIEFIKNNAY